MTSTAVGVETIARTLIDRLRMISSTLLGPEQRFCQQILGGNFDSSGATGQRPWDRPVLPSAGGITAVLELAPCFGACPSPRLQPASL